ncbi:uncharacterized protein LOC128972239 [Indicator indicator]|uniref:uncharacterized protein LOC128972239 n=1 Tax=Indicator indicator TaxID=1002788 RepID=UPI0023DEF59D|nr:uncharacterized protein LOC128972239 [Indicator indicator]
MYRPPRPPPTTNRPNKKVRHPRTTDGAWVVFAVNYLSGARGGRLKRAKTPGAGTSSGCKNVVKLPPKLPPVDEGQKVSDSKPPPRSRDSPPDSFTITPAEKSMGVSSDSVREGLRADLCRRPQGGDSLREGEVQGLQEPRHQVPGDIADLPAAASEVLGGLPARSQGHLLKRGRVGAVWTPTAFLGTSASSRPGQSLLAASGAAAGGVPLPPCPEEQLCQPLNSSNCIFFI